ncbi:MAG: RNA-binding transcriptional accessory protein [Deltaproteobacteria bacterium]|jgi:protein Tex|nr:RNA-binding transcriptional accessory protein [Deltaproteobacteria bacterium]
MSQKATVRVQTGPIIASELNLPLPGVSAVLKLLADGNTIPFIARYRKEVTGGLDEVAVEAIQERNQYIVDLEDRRSTVLASIKEQGKLSDALEKRILACDTKSKLEDIYLPFKPKRRTRATIARERGLEPLADLILQQPIEGTPEQAAALFINLEKEVADIEAALKGARDIVAEAVSERSESRQLVRDALMNQGVLTSVVTSEFKEKRSRFEQYYTFSEPVSDIPSHRFLAIRRGEREGALRVTVELDSEPLKSRLLGIMEWAKGSTFSAQLIQAVDDAYNRLLAPTLETDIRAEVKMKSDRAAVEIFASNMRDLLLAAPFGARGVIGIDPGLRTGSKCVALDGTGRFIETTTLFISRGQRDALEAETILAGLIEKHKPRAIAVGNGTGGRETETFVKKVLRDTKNKDISVISVNEAGASIYSASPVARDEFPELDLTIRGAISIGRRLQDPLAELVKIEPKSIGVGQYQHDVYQPLLTRKLTSVVESCVNGVGVHLNTASPSLLGYVAGIGPTLAKRIVEYRSSNGPFSKREDLTKVPGLGPKAFEQAAGFLRIPDGENPLDASAVHPERYSLVAQWAKELGVELKDLVGNRGALEKLDLTHYLTDDVGELTLKDMVDELKKPGRDPRDTFEAPAFRDDVHEVSDLKLGMWLEGVVTNVTAFGAFVDVGVHQDGLVHVSQLADRFVSDPLEVVRPGQKIRVRVMDVDLERRRISLSARTDAEAPEQRNHSKGPDRADKRPAANRGKGGGGQSRKPQREFKNNPFAALLK